MVILEYGIGCRTHSVTSHVTYHICSSQHDGFRLTCRIIAMMMVKVAVADSVDDGAL